MLRVSLQTKILGLVLSLILLITLLLSGVYVYLAAEQVEKQTGQLALQVSKTISLMPAIHQAFLLKDPSTVIQPLAEEIRKEVGAEFIVVGNKDGIRYSHPVPSRIGKKMVGGDNERALKLGKYYTSKAVGTLGPSLRGKSPIFDSKGHIIGIVSVGFLLDDIKAKIWAKAIKVSYVALGVFLVGIIGSIILARNIRKDTFGLEPYQIASLYKERSAILESLKEGVIAINKEGYITIMNRKAQDILGFYEEFQFKKIEDVIPDTQLYEVLSTGKAHHNQETAINNQIVIVNREPIRDSKDTIVGVVSSFRLKNDIEDMLNTLSEVQRYSEDLRAQTHEFTNKMHVVSGLIQLNEYEEALQFIQKETVQFENQNKVLFDQIKDTKVQAILIGKLAKASEKKVLFTIEEHASLNPLPPHIELTQLIVILGNLIDNAIEAVMGSQDAHIHFFTTDLGDDIIFEIADNGQGVKHDHHDLLFTKGFSTKSGDDLRGYGLANVKEALDKLNGNLELVSEWQKGTVFTVFIPKVRRMTE